MSLQELFQGMSLFKDGVRELQTSRVISEANEAVSQIRGSELDETKKRAELEGLSRQLVGSLHALGNPVSAIQNLAQSFGPKQYASADQAILDGTMSGNSQVAALGQKADEASTANQLKLMGAKSNIDEASQKRLFEHQLTLQSMREAQADKKKNKAGDVEFNTNVQVAMKEATKLERLVGKVGNWEKLDTTASAQLQSAAYQLAINYAKIVDPASVAREGEVAAAQKYMVPLGLGTRNSVSLAAIKEFKAKILEYTKARANANAGTNPAVNANAEQSATAPATNSYFKPYAK